MSGGTIGWRCDECDGFDMDGPEECTGCGQHICHDCITNHHKPDGLPCVEIEAVGEEGSQP